MTSKKTVPETFDSQGQTYTVVGSRPHVTRAGAAVPVLQLRSECPICQAEFEFTATDAQISTRRLLRRCRNHRSGRTSTVKTHLKKFASAARRSRRRATGMVVAAQVALAASIAHLAPDRRREILAMFD